MAGSKSRRSFLGECLQLAAGGWLGIVSLSTLLSGCKEGGQASTPTEPGTPAPMPRDLVAEYGVRRSPQIAAGPDAEIQAATPMYGVQQPSRPKYGVDESDVRPIATAKYGVREPPPPVPAYGVRPPPPTPPDNNVARPRYGVRLDMQPDVAPPKKAN
jgi:hypothetical protein